jgi:hypothetical protein
VEALTTHQTGLPLVAVEQDLIVIQKNLSKLIITVNDNAM